MRSIVDQPSRVLHRLVLPLALALLSLDAAAANGSALADQTRWIHRVQAQCAKVAPARCVVIARRERAAVPLAVQHGSPRAAQSPNTAPAARAAAASHGRDAAHTDDQPSRGHVIGLR